MVGQLRTIAQNVAEVLRELPPGVKLVAAIKTRGLEEVLDAVGAGVTALGANYVQEAERLCGGIGRRVEWHFIGHLQRNKVKKAAAIFDMIETVDSTELAGEIDRRCAEAGKLMPVLIEVNSGREAWKFGVMPGDAEGLVREIACLPHIRVAGLMTMGTVDVSPADTRECFRETRKLFDYLRCLCLPSVSMEYLSMGMSDSYHIAIEEGANIVRLGTRLFGARPVNVCKEGG